MFFLFTIEKKTFCLFCSHKPQNLTPPGSSDGGSSGSGQSPTSTHPGSPPSTISSSTMKRPGYIDGADGLPTKRQRISHFRKPSELPSIAGRLPDSSQQQQQRSTVADSSSQPEDFFQRNRDRRDAIKTNPRIREYNGSRGIGSGGGGGNSGDALSRNGYGGHHYDNTLVSSGMNGRCISAPGNEENDDKRSAQGGYESSAVAASKAHSESVASNTSGGRSVCSGTNVTSATVDNSSPAWNRSTENGSGVLSQSSSRGPGGHHDNRNSRWSSRVSSTTQKNSTSGFSPDSQLENVDTGGREKESKETSASSSTDYPEYLL